MARSLIILIILALITLSVIPNPQNPSDSAWGNIAPPEHSSPFLFERNLAEFNIHLPAECIPILCLFGVAVIVWLLKKINR